ncbi:MAG: antitoxin [Thermoanaerobaculia bacterium]
MIRVQIQLPDELHTRAKRLAAAKEISLAELARRGVELVLAQSPAPAELDTPWSPPIVRGLGWRGLSHAQIKEAAQKTATEEGLEEHAGIASGV